LSFDPAALICELSHSLLPPDRESFRTAAETALAQLSCPGPGAAYRALVPLQRQFFQPPTGREAQGPIDLTDRRSRLTAEPPLAMGRDKRRTRISMR
jgi:hypothetical protein